MLSSNVEEENDVFFDTADSWSSSEETGRLDYDIWMSEPQSVRRRRERFLYGMGLAEFSSEKTCKEEEEFESDCSLRITELERLTECSGAVSSSDGCSKSDIELSILEADHEEETGLSVVSHDCGKSEEEEAEDHPKGCENFDMGKKKMKSWWKFFMKNKKEQASRALSKSPGKDRLKVHQKKKRVMEFTAVYVNQEIDAHKGFIWTMKFSPDGQYLASGGEDGVVRIWQVTSMDSSNKYLNSDGHCDDNARQGESSFFKKHSKSAAIVIPQKVFHIGESPLYECHGHSSDVLDLAWSDSNYLLSSSMDKTVRLWQVGYDQCLNIFQHQNYVTCIQFNPVNENNFISGSVDGKVRIWGIDEKRVVDWADIREVITAICYKPDGKGFVVGSITGTCRFYEASGERCKLNTQLQVQGKKKAYGKRITGIQFSQENVQRVMITSEDSKLRIFDGVDIIEKYKGPPKAGSQMSASFTSSGKHIISVGEDSHVYVWNCDCLSLPSYKQPKSVQSFEYFLSKDVTIAIPWSGMGRPSNSGSHGHPYRSQRHEDVADLPPWIRDSEGCSLGNWFYSIDGHCRSAATWPEEKLPFYDLPVAGDDNYTLRQNNDQQLQYPETWGLVILTAGCDGTIRTMHNYGLPVRIQ